MARLLPSKQESGVAPLLQGQESQLPRGEGSLVSPHPQEGVRVSGTGVWHPQEERVTGAVFFQTVLPHPQAHLACAQVCEEEGVLQVLLPREQPQEEVWLEAVLVQEQEGFLQALLVQGHL